MGNNLFGANISGQLFAALGPLLPAVKLLKTVQGTRDPSDPSAGTSPTTATYTGRGILDSYRTSQIDETIIQQGDRKVLILGDSLPSGILPDTGDKVEAEGRVFTVIAVERDPDAATYTCQVRG